MGTPFNLALVQTNSGNQVGPNVVAVSEMIRAAHGAGAELVMLPETVSLMETRSKLVFEQVRPQDDDEALKANRLALLNNLRNLFLQVADISLLQ